MKLVRKTFSWKRFQNSCCLLLNLFDVRKLWSFKWKHTQKSKDTKSNEWGSSSKLATLQQTQNWSAKQSFMYIHVLYSQYCTHILAPKLGRPPSSFYTIKRTQYCIVTAWLFNTARNIYIWRCRFKLLLIYICITSAVTILKKSSFDMFYSIAELNTDLFQVGLWCELVWRYRLWYVGYLLLYSPTLAMLENLWRSNLS